jgi:Fe2+ or Zn2+ uptake regulation protein
MDTWKDQLASKGCRITASREAIVGILQEAEVPLSPHEIRDRAEALHRGIGLVTVYRTLELLAKLGLVRRVHRDDGCHGYLPATQGHHHALICHDCGRAVEFPGREDLETLIQHVEKKTGYRVEDHLLQLSGTCPGCQNLSSSASHRH